MSTTPRERSAVLQRTVYTEQGDTKTVETRAQDLTKYSGQAGGGYAGKKWEGSEDDQRHII